MNQRKPGRQDAIYELRERLNASRRALVGRVAETSAGLQELAASAPEEMEEEAQESHLAQSLGTLDEHGRAELAEIDEAIARIERGEYGQCETCGEPIGIERLRAIPTARECIEDAERRERLARASGRTNGGAVTL